MALKLCCTVIVALILTINSNIYALPLFDLLNAEKSSSSSAESSESIESGENTTVNGTQKDL